jgi:hypothetical protein
VQDKVAHVHLSGQLSLPGQPEDKEGCVFTLPGGFAWLLPSDIPLSIIFIE